MTGRNLHANVDFISRGKKQGSLVKDFPHLNKLQFQITEKRITEQQVTCVRSINISPAMQISRSHRGSAVCLGSSAQDKRFLSLADCDLHHESQRDAQVSV